MRHKIHTVYRITTSKVNTIFTKYQYNIIASHLSYMDCSFNLAASVSVMSNKEKTKRPFKRTAVRLRLMQFYRF